MGKWNPPSETLGEHLAEAVAEYDCQPRKMFGCPCYFVNDNMFCGVHEDSIILRLSQDEKKRLLDTYDEVAPFDPMGGRPMREYVTIPDALASEPGVLGDLVKSSFTFASSLPPKKKKPRRKK